MADDALKVVKSEPLPELTVVKSEPDEPFVPKTAKEFIDRMGKAAVDVPYGMLKGAARVGQSIPGVSQATDWAFGLPKGASEKETEPTNASQKAGTYLNDVALAVATVGAETGAPVVKAGQLFGRSTVGELGMDAAKSGASAVGDTVKAIGAKLSTGGPVTPDKVADLVVKYGKYAVRTAVIGGGGYGAWTAVKHLLF